MENYIVVDLETTGLTPKRDRILEIGAWKVEKGAFVAQFHSMVDPCIQIPERITTLTGITDAMVAGQPRIAEVIRQFLDFAGELPLLGHNLQFDYAFLVHAAVNEGLNFSRDGADTLKISRKVLAELPSRRLGDLCAYYGISQERAHRADEDAYVTALLYEKLKAQFGGADPELFAPVPMVYKAKKQQPITNAQKGYLNDLLKYHTIKCDMQIDSLTKSEASRLIDGIILQYGRIMH